MKKMIAECVAGAAVVGVATCGVYGTWRIAEQLIVMRGELMMILMMMMLKQMMMMIELTLMAH